MNMQQLLAERDRLIAERAELEAANEYIDAMQTVIAALRSAPAEYPPELLQARRAEFLAAVRGPRCHGFEQRLAAIEAMLDSGLDTETVNNLIEEQAEIITQLGKE